MKETVAFYAEKMDSQNWFMSFWKNFKVKSFQFFANFRSNVQNLSTFTNKMFNCKMKNLITNLIFDYPKCRCSMIDRQFVQYSQ